MVVDAASRAELPKSERRERPDRGRMWLGSGQVSCELIPPESHFVAAHLSAAAAKVTCTLRILALISPGSPKGSKCLELEINQPKNSKQICSSSELNICSVRVVGTQPTETYID